MLELRPNCEHCDKDLTPASLEARICSFECTFCQACVEHVLANVCPNCGGGFCARPVRPARKWQGEASLSKYPASATRRHRPVDPVAQRALVAALQNVPPEQR